MPPKLSQEEIVSLHVLKDKGVSNVEAGRTLGVAEGTVRYHVRRKAKGAVDGRRKVYKAAKLAAVIDEWMRVAKECGVVNLQELHEELVAEHGYLGSYRSVLRYVRFKYRGPKLRPYRRVETPPGAQAQVDWAHFEGVDIGNGPQDLYALVMTLSHSRKEAIVWCTRMDQLSWHHGHNECFRRLEGVPAVLRIDNLKTGVAVGAGPWGQINAAYQAYARAMRFHVDACLPKAPEDKGKVERRIGATRSRIDPGTRRFQGLAPLQEWTDLRVAFSGRRRICPVTGKSVEESWQDEKKFLQPLPILPQVFDVVVTRPVHSDCTVNFENRSYSVPFRFTDREVEVRGCAEVVQFVCDGQVVAEWPRRTAERLLINPAHYEGPGDERVAAPVPLGKMGRKLQEIVLQPVHQRPVDLYAALAEVAR